MFEDDGYARTMYREVVTPRPEFGLGELA